MTRSIRAAVAVVFVLGLASGVQAAPIGVGFGGGVWAINTTTGAATFVGASGFARLNSLAIDTFGGLYSVAELGDYPGPYGPQLVTINPTTGAGTLVGSISGLPTQYSSVRGLAFSSAGTLYAAVDTDPDGNYVGPDSLYTVDPLTGALTPVGPTGRVGLQGIDFGSGGVMFGWDVGDAFSSGTDQGLITVDPLTGAATDVNPAEGGNSSIQTLAFGPDGLLYGAGNGLYRVDPLTGVPTQVGAGWSYEVDLRGLAFTPDSTPPAVPEPASLLLFGTALLGTRCLRRKRR